MEDIILKVENLSKQYRLGTVGTGTLGHDLNRAWHRIRGKEDPYLKIGAVNDRSATTTSDYVWALKDINFEVKRGEILGIIGKNGAGKSTLLKILSRVTSPSTGSIKTKGRIASLLEVGTGMHPELTGLENIYLNGAILGMTKAEIRLKIDEIVEFSGCQMYIDTPVKRYSSGMRVRLGFAVAAFLEPDILVVDEVLAVGDAEFQKKAIGKMQDISRSGRRTVLFVSHNMAAVLDLCTRVVLIENGYIKSAGETKSIINQYLTKEANNQKNDLKIRTDRKGSLRLKIVEASILDKYGDQKGSILIGDRLIFNLKLSQNGAVDFTKLIVSFEIQGVNGERISLFSSDEMNADFKDVEVKKIVQLELDSINLRPGNYSLRVVMTEGTTRESDFLDALDDVITFTVLTRDFYSSGKKLRNINMALFNAKFI